VAAGVIGSAEGPAWAGEMEVTLSARQNSSAVRIVAKIYAALLRSTARKTEAIYTRILPLFAPRQFPVSRGIPAAFAEQDAPRSCC
jgi:hypothetical protein